MNTPGSMTTRITQRRGSRRALRRSSYAMRSASRQVSRPEACARRALVRGDTRSTRARRPSRRSRGRTRAKRAQARPSRHRAVRSARLRTRAWHPTVAVVADTPATRVALAGARRAARQVCAGAGDSPAPGRQAVASAGELELKVLTRYRRMPNGADRCCPLRTALRGVYAGNLAPRREPWRFPGSVGV